VQHHRRRCDYDTTMKRTFSVPSSDLIGNGRHVKLALAYEIIQRMPRLRQLLRTSRYMYLPFQLMTSSIWCRCSDSSCASYWLPDKDVVVIKSCQSVNPDLGWQLCTVCWTYHTSCDRNSIECVAFEHSGFVLVTFHIASCIGFYGVAVMPDTPVLYVAVCYEPCLTVLAINADFAAPW